jgi:hypothetical protein
MFGHTPWSTPVAVALLASLSTAVHAELISIDFTNMVNFVELQGFDGQGGDIDVLNMRAYNDLDQLVVQSTVIDLFGPTGATISVLGDNISYVEFGVEADISGLFYDNLVYNTIPAPTSVATIALGFMGCRRKRIN